MGLQVCNNFVKHSFSFLCGFLLLASLVIERNLDFPSNFELNITSESFLLNMDQVCSDGLNPLYLTA